MFSNNTQVFDKNEYESYLYNKITQNLHYSKNLIKINSLETNNILIPSFDTASNLYNYNYNVNQLKAITKHYNLKISGNKPQLIARIYMFLHLSKFVIKIQKYYRGHLLRKYIKYHGPAFKNRSLCTNTFDFLSMDELTSIEPNQFFSFKEDDGFIYGFDLLSLYNLIYTSNGAVKNPFNKNQLSKQVIQDFRSLLRLSHILKIKIATEIIDISKEVSERKAVEFRALTLFQNIDALGNYSNVDWFMSLTRNQLLHFTAELIDIWNYRALLTLEKKNNICPPYGDPFRSPFNFRRLHIMSNIDEMRKSILHVMEKMVCSGTDKDSKCLGAFYVIGALTLVNNDAATALPWLYESLYYN